MLSSKAHIIHGFLVSRAHSKRFESFLNEADSSPVFEVVNLSYGKKTAVGIKADLPLINARENFVEINEMSGDTYLQLCMLAHLFGFKESDIKTYTYAELFDPNYGTMDSW